MVVRSRGVMTLLSSSASRIGMGKKNTSWNAVMIRVFSTASRNSGLANTRSKLAQPTYGLRRNPVYGE